MPNHVTNIIEFEGDAARIKEILYAIKLDEEELGSFDFNKVIPMPSTMNITSGGSQGTAVSAYLSAVNPDTEDMGIEKVTKEEFDKKVALVLQKRLFYVPSNLNTNMPYSEIVEEANKYYNSSIEEASVTRYDLVQYGKTVVENLETYGCADWYSWSCAHWGTKWNAYHHREQEDDATQIEFDTAWSAPHPVIQKLSMMYPDVKITHKWADEDMGNNCGIAEYIEGCGEPEYLDGTKDAYKFAAEVLGYPIDDCYEAKDGTLFNVDCDMPEKVSEEQFEEWKSKGFSFYGWKSKIKFDKTTKIYDISALTFDEKCNMLKRMEKHGISISDFFYY